MRRRGAMAGTSSHRRLVAICTVGLAACQQPGGEGPPQESAPTAQAGHSGATEPTQQHGRAPGPARTIPFTTLRTRDGRLRIADPTLGDDPAGSRRLLELLDTSDDRAVRLAAVEALPRTRGAWAAGAAARLDAERDPAVRVALVAALGRARGMPRSRALLRGIQDADPGVRLEAALSAASLAPGAVHTPAVVTGLTELLVDELSDVRAAAARSLGVLHATDAFEALQPLLTDGDPRVRRQSARALMRVDARRAAALPALRALRRDRDASVRRTVDGLLVPRPLGQPR